METFRECPYCLSPSYALGDGMHKCRRCRKKFSPRRHEKVLRFIEAFCLGETALECAGRLGHSYVSVHRHFDMFRHLCARISEERYESLRHKPCEYEEYFYLERSKRGHKNAVFDAHNFLTFDYGGHLYTIVMPSLDQYRQQFIDDNLESVYSAEFARFKRQSRLIKISKRYNSIVRFWEYFEQSILRYKGVSRENFPLYLKEMEFKFNYRPEEQQVLLKNHYYELKS
jgi:transposase